MTKAQAPRDPALVAFGQKVREARERAGRKQGDFAAEVGITRQHLTNVETARYRASNVVLWRIANALEIDASDVVQDVAS